MPPLIRLATPADLPYINTIYNHYVLTSTCTYQTEPSTEAQRNQWFTGTPPDRYPTTVALDNTGHILGWGALRPFHPRAAFRFTAENSVYVHPDHHRQGIGRALLADLLTRAAPFRSIIAVISADQTPSICLHTDLGFIETGRLPNVGYKFSRWLDVVYLQYQLPNSIEPDPHPAQLTP